ncbi:hypothetical protein MBANPS3_006854 [Mucor bainieri]
MATSTVATTINTPKTTVLEAPQLKEEHKVFIGNLSFKTTKESLATFASASGKVVDATIITKQRRSLGYGFVTFETEQDAQKAAKDLDSKSLDGREINVEVARPKADASTDAPQKTRKSKSNARRRSKSAAASLLSSSSAKEEDSVVPTEKEEQDGIVPTTKKKDIAAEKKVEMKKETPVDQELKNDEIVADAEATEEQDQEKTPEQIAKEAAARRKRNQKDKKRQNKKKSIEKATRVTEPSKTTLFVANLPYATTDDDLNTIFKDYKLVSAHVARMNNGCSKGYGFVELESEQEQLKALESVKDVVLEGRAIYLKIALSEQKVPVINAESKAEEEVQEKETLDKDAKKEESISEKDTVADALKANDTN